MFEDALVESSGRMRTRPGWLSGVAAVCNGGALCALLMLPLWHPALLPERMPSILLAAPSAPAVALVKPIVSVAARSTAVANPFAAPQRIPDSIRNGDEAAPVSLHGDLLAQASGIPDGLPDSIGASPASPPVSVLRLRRNRQSRPA